MSGYQFGPFDLDIEQSELRKGGVQIRIQKQPFLILRTLVEKAPLLVSREELRHSVWPSDTFVDFDHGLNAAVNKVRQALGDSTGRELYIETVPGQGYRFVAPIERPRVKGHTSSARSKNRAVAMAASVGVVVACLAAGYYYFHRTPKLSDKDTIVLGEFVNKTGDAVFDGTLRQGLAVQLEQSPFLSIVSEERSEKTLRLMGQAAEARVTPALGREICVRTGSAAVLDGSIVNLGSQYVLALRATNCRTGDVIYEDQSQVARKEDVLSALSRIASKFRVRIGESLATVRSHDTPLEEATTTSLDALKAFTERYKADCLSGFVTALPLFRRAVVLDPNFAMAHAMLGRIYGDVAEYTLSAESTAKAYELRERTSDREKLFISASYDLQVTGNIEKARQTLKLWAQTYPRDSVPGGLLSGAVYPVFGKFEKAIETAKGTIRLDPDFGFAYINLAYAYLNNDQLLEAAKVNTLAAERNIEIPDFLVERYLLAFLNDDQPGMDRVIALSKTNLGAEGWIEHHQSLVLAYSGHLREARAMSRRASDLATQVAHQKERAGLYEAAAALREAFFENPDEASRRASEALSLSKGRDVEYGAALALALSGDLSQAQSLAADLAQRFPEDTSVQFSYLPTIRAIVALSRGGSEKALDLLQISIASEMGTPLCDQIGNFGGLYPAFVRGQAYLKARRGEAAAAEFQKTLDHRGVVLDDPTGALARLQLARAYAISADSSKARAAYREFLTLWKNADPDVPIFKRAKAEYASLR